MPRRFPVKKTIVTRRLTGNSDTDKALKDVYDKIDDLQPVLAKEESPLINRKAKIGDTMLVQNDVGEDILAVFTAQGWKIDINSKLISVDGRNFRPLSGLRSMNYRVNPGESVKYTKFTDYALNDILRWNGREFIASQEGSVLSFSWDTLVLDFIGGDAGHAVTGDDTTDSTDPTGTRTHTGVLVGNSGGTWATGVNIDCTMSNFSFDNRFTSVTVTWQRVGETSAANLNALTDATDFTGVNSDNTVTLNYPTTTEGAATTSTDYYQFVVTFKYKLDPTSDTETTYTSTQRIYFGNYGYLGLNSGSSALDSDAIKLLTSKQKTTSYMTTAGPSMGTTTITLPAAGDAKYIHYYYPKRVTTAPTFATGPPGSESASAWTSLGTDISVENTRGYTELYTGYRSQEPVDATNADEWSVIITH